MISARVTTAACFGMALACGLLACAGESRPERATAPTAAATSRATRSASAQSVSAPSTPSAPARPSRPPASEAPLPSAPGEPDFDAPLPDEACPPVQVRLSHRSATLLPAVLTHAVAFRAEDGRHVRVALSDVPLPLDAAGRFVAPGPGHARFEMDAVRTRRRPLSPRVLGPPGTRLGGLTHARVVTSGPLLPFGARNIGRVELTEVSPTRICGRIDLDDGFGRVRGGFTATVQGAFPL